MNLSDGSLDRRLCTALISPAESFRFGLQGFNERKQLSEVILIYRKQPPRSALEIGSRGGGGG